MISHRVFTVAWRLVNGLAVLVSVAVIAAVVALGTALAAGYRPVIITGGSMGATVPDGSLVVARPVAEVAVGDILVMRRSGRATVTHRIVDLDRAGFEHPGSDHPGSDHPGSEDPESNSPRFAITRGDANPQVDPAPYPLGERELIARWTVPHLGTVVLELATPLYGTAIVAAVVLLLTALALGRIWRFGATEPATDPAAGPEPPEPPEPPARPRLNRPAARFGLAALVAGVVGAASVAWAFYLDSAPVSGNQFTTPECFQARVSGVQKGTHLATATGTGTVAINPVDPDRSFLVFSSRSSGSDANDALLLGQLASSTSLTFVRTTDTPSPPPIAVDWTVVSYTCGVSVQRGTITGDGSSFHDVPVTPVATGASFVLGSWVAPAGAADHDGDDMVTFTLTSPTSLRIASDAPGIAPGTELGWQVVTFNDPADASVQQVTATLTAGTGTATVPLPVPADPATTLVIAGARTAATGDDIGERAVRVRLLDPNTVEVHRSITTDQVTVEVQVVTLNDGSVVQHGIVNLDPLQPTETPAIAPVDVNRSTVSSTVQWSGSMSGGATDQVGGAVAGEAAATAVFTSSTALSIERASSASSASFAWQVVTWGGPGWADTNWPFRQRVDVSAGAVDAPNGYTTPLTLDHQAMVASGLSTASGDDLRLWHHDGTGWTELDRVLDPTSTWNSATTTIWFRTREQVAAGRSSSYWLYFGNPVAGAPPEDPDNVWLLREGFEGGPGAFEDRTGGTGWYSADPWTRRLVLTVDSGTVDAILTDQPVLVRLTSPDLAAQAQPDGSDIRFTAADGTTDLPHEVESYEPVTGTVTAWVLVPSLSPVSDTTLHLYYGAPDAPAQADPRSVWAGELAVWHLNRSRTGPAPSLDDVSASQLDGLALGDTSQVDTPSGPAADLDGMVDRLEASPRDLPDGPLTVAAWFQPDTVTGTPVLVGQGDPSSGGVFELAVADGSTRFRISIGGAMVELDGGTVTAGQWHHAAATWDGTTVILYLDGQPVASTPASGSTPNGANLAVTLGGDAAGIRTLDGRLGEAGLAARAWSAAEISFRHQNLRDPSATVAPSGPAAGSWFAAGTWSMRRPLTVSADLVAGPLGDYPLLVQLVEAQLAAVAQMDGDDLVFVAADGVTRLDHHLDAWDGTSGALTAWVRLPTISATVDTNLFLYLGNPAAGNQEDPEAVWGADADLVLTG